jgi:hypothetical protein
MTNLIEYKTGTYIELTPPGSVGGMGNLPKNPKPIVIRKSRTTGNWVWRCGGKNLKNCFSRWGSDPDAFRAILEAVGHYQRWHVGGER